MRRFPRLAKRHALSQTPPGKGRIFACCQQLLLGRSIQRFAEACLILAIHRERAARAIFNSVLKPGSS
jgi:hypothetical protein